MKNSGPLPQAQKYVCSVSRHVLGGDARLFLETSGVIPTSSPLVTIRTSYSIQHPWALVAVFLYTLT